MKHTVFVCLLFVLATGVNTEGFAQEDQGGGVGLRFRDLRLDQVNPSMIKKYHRTENARILSGVRRLVPQGYATIQAAIDSSTHGDTVLVSDGLYLENIRFHGKAIIVASLFLVDGDTSHIDQTIIDGSSATNPDSASVVYFIDGEDTTSVLCGFTIRGGAGTEWRSPNSDFWQDGGGVYCFEVFGATIIDNHITQNRVSGAFASSAGIIFDADGGYFILERNRFSDNSVSANPGTGLGGAVLASGDELYVRIIGNVFERNTILAQNYAVGGAIFLGGQQSLAGGVIQENLFRENIADATAGNGVGGGVYCHTTSGMKISDNVFEDNIAKSQNAWAEGGAICLEDTDVPQHGRKSIMANQFIGNITISQNGNARGGAIELFRTTATIDRNYFSDNMAQAGSGSYGGAMGLNYSAFQLENNIVCNNSAPFGAGAYANQLPNYGTGQAIINNTIADNIGPGIRIFNSNLLILNTILWGNSGGGIQLASGTPNVQYSNVQGSVLPGTGNISVEPFFADNIDYQLSDSSLCIGAGIDSIQIGSTWYYAPPTDMGGNLRPNPSNCAPDMGAWESVLCGSPTVLPGQTTNNTPETYSLYENYPNPFNPSTTIEFYLPKSSEVTLKIFNILGEEVATLVSDKLSTGTYSYEWDASNFASGVYLYRVQAGDYVETKKMVLMR